MHLTDLPRIDGVTWRMFRDDDYDDIARLLTEDLEVGGHGSLVTVADIRTEYQSLEGLDEASDVLIAETSDGVIGHVTAATWKELDGPQILFHAGRVSPAWKRRGLGSAMLGWVHRRLVEMTAASDGDTLVRTTGVSSSTTEFMTKNGYAVTQHEANLVRPNLDDIPDAPLPRGMVVRPVAESDLRAIYEAEIEHFKDHWGASEESSKWWDTFLIDPHLDPSLWQIGYDGDQVIGIVRPHIREEENIRMGRKRGYTEDISTNRDWRCRGVATALIALALAAQRDRGMTESALSVHVENPHGAYRLYEGLGFKLHSRMDTLDLAKS